MDDRYQIITKLGQTGWFTVYQAEQIEPNRPVLMKMLHGNLAADNHKVQRFTSRAAALKGLTHPHIASLYDFGISSYGQAYLVFENASGSTLSEYLQKQASLTILQALNIGQQILDALAMAHAKGIVHRDLKPQNIIIADDTTYSPEIKIYDFALAELLSIEHLSFEELTQSGMMIGTPTYMSPEQLSGQPADQRADIYSFGCIMYEMLCGQTPFQDASGPFHMVQSHRQGKPVPINELLKARQVPLALETLVMRALNKDPAQRFESAADLLQALEKIESNLRRRPSVRARLLVCALGIALLAAAGWAGLRDHHIVQKAGRQPPAIHTGESKTSTVQDIGKPDSEPPAAQGQSAPSITSTTPPTSTAQHPAGAQQLCDDGAASFRSGDYKKAEQAYSRAIHLNSDLMAAYEGRAIVYLKMGKIQESLNDCRTYLRHNPQDAPAYYCMGRLYMSLGNYRLSIDCLSKSLQLSPDAPAFCDRGLLYLRLHKPDLARRDLAAIDELAAAGKQTQTGGYVESTRALLAGALEVYDGKHRDALGDLTAVVQQHPTWKSAYLLRAQCYDRLGNRQLAERDRARAAALSDLSDLDVGG